LIASTTLNFNAVGPLTETLWRPAPWPQPGLRTQINRGSWLSRHLTAQGTDWSLADFWVDESIRQGLEPLALLTDDPSAGPFDAEVHGAHCRTAAKRYLGRVKRYECVNEYDTEGNWCFDGFAGGEQAGLAWRTTVDAIASVDPDAVVICGSIQSIWPLGHGLQTLAGALRAYGPQLPSDIAIHAYPTVEQVALVPRMIERVRGACRAHAKGEPRIWVTEWSLWPAVFSGMTSKAQGAFLRTMLRHFRDADVYCALHYLFDDGNGFGFVDKKVGKTTWNNAVVDVFGKAGAPPPL
jgi:hypothetical protein